MHTRTLYPRYSNLWAYISRGIFGGLTPHFVIDRFIDSCTPQIYARYERLFLWSRKYINLPDIIQRRNYLIGKLGSVFDFDSYERY